MITFQQLLQNLSRFWESKGCVLHFGHDVEVGAGTFNPATFLRCLGPEPYNTAYVEPSRRPADARYAENPNRVQLFHQYQVILKPAPKQVQQWYLDSLSAVGIDLAKHDIRFVHSDWESPTLGAWGLGWEVWCDGMEISQFTYFQAMASLPLNPVSAEITYGLERLAMYIQNVDSIFDLAWNEKLTMRDISEQLEIEWSRYNLEKANSDMWRRHFDDYEKESKELIAHNLPIPAYDFVLKASHAFNMLDARGVISVTERTGYITRVRDLARLVGVEYLHAREKWGFPLSDLPLPTQQALPPQAPLPFNPAMSQDLLLEIGSEEIPDTFIPSSVKQLEKALETLLQKHTIPFNTIKIYATPRRLAAYITEVREGSEKKHIEKRGPAISRAFDDTGAPTAEGIGFLKALGMEPLSLEAVKKESQLKIVTIKESDYLFATIEVEGQSTHALLSQELPGVILSLDFPKKMHWDSYSISYARPIRWIVALFGDQVIPFQLGEIASSNFSFGHKQLDNRKITLSHPSSYLSTLKQHYVLAEIEEREKSICDQIEKMEKELEVTIAEQERVLPQVLYLSEWPQLDYSTFNPQFLTLPQEAIASEMVEHQKYFPVKKGETLTHYFIITADNIPSELIRKGNQKVLSARLNDAAFLYAQDLQQPLEKFNEKLAKMTFQKELGSMLDKVMRIIDHAKRLNNHLSLADQSKVDRAALLCKADLASALVAEFPDLQGTLGKYYALQQKEDPEVARAIEEHWWPKSEKAELPQTALGILISLADKLDNLIGYFSIGLQPTSSSDPYALRRQTLGLLKILIENKLSLNLKTLLTECVNRRDSSALIEEILGYITVRAKGFLQEKGFKKEEVEASMTQLLLDPYDQFCKLSALHSFRQESDSFLKLVEVYKRAKGQLGEKTTTPFHKDLTTEPAEKQLVQALEKIEKKWKETLAAKNYRDAFLLMTELQQPLANLFDTVQILSDETTLRNNRIALLHKVFGLFEELLDFSQIQTTSKRS